MFFLSSITFIWFGNRIILASSENDRACLEPSNSEKPMCNSGVSYSLSAWQTSSPVKPFGLGIILVGRFFKSVFNFIFWHNFTETIQKLCMEFHVSFTQTPQILTMFDLSFSLYTNVCVCIYLHTSTHISFLFQNVWEYVAGRCSFIPKNCGVYLLKTRIL